MVVTPLELAPQGVAPVLQVRKLLTGQAQVAVVEPQMPRLLAVAEGLVARAAGEAVVVVRLSMALTPALVALGVKVMHEFTVGKGITWATQK